MELFTLGEAMDKVEKGKIAVCTMGADQGLIIGVESFLTDNYVWALLNNKVKFHFFFNKNNETPEKRFIIIDEPAEIKVNVMIALEKAFGEDDKYNFEEQEVK